MQQKTLLINCLVIDMRRAGAEIPFISATD